MVPVLNQINAYSNEVIMRMMQRVEGMFLTPLLAPSNADNWRQMGWLGRAWADLRQIERLEIVKYGSVAAHFMLSTGCLAFSLLPVDPDMRYTVVVLGAIASTICRCCSMYMGVTLQDDAPPGGRIGVACYVCIPFSLLCSIVDPLNPETRFQSNQLTLFTVDMVIITKLFSICSEYMIRKAGFAKAELRNARWPDPVQWREFTHKIVVQDMREGRPMRVHRNYPGLF